jgi:competence protein ComEC
VLGLLVLDPELGVQPGFALSVLATAQLATAPLVAALSGQVSLVAVVANLLVAPVVAPATVLGAAAAALAPVHDAAAEVAARLAGPFVQWLVFVGHHAAGLPGAALGWPAGATGALMLTALLVLSVALLRLPRLRTALVAAAMGALIVLVPTRLAPPGWPASDWAVVACDVGQGDATVLATGEQGEAVLVDAGPEPAALDGCLARLGVQRLPLVVLSHLHADHVGGLAAALDGVAIGAVALGPSRQPTWAFDQVRRLVERAGVPLVQLHAGQRLQWSALRIEVLGPRERPPAPVDSPEGTPVNDNSVVMRADTPAGRVLLTGDVELAGQAALLGSGVDLRADVLKVPHHGSRYSARAFLEAVQPRVALVSVGAGNDYGHPSHEVVGLLASSGAIVLRTDERGDIAVTSGDGGLAVVARGDPHPARGARP